MMQLTKWYPDQLFRRLANRFGELSLSLALTEMTSKENAPEYLITLRDKHFERLVEQKMTPQQFVEVFLLDVPEFKAHTYTSLDHFLKAYNAKNEEARVSVLKAQRSSGYWKTDSKLLLRLDIDKWFDLVANLRFNDLSLLLVLTRMASEKYAPSYVKTLRDKHFERLVEQEMRPEKFVEVFLLDVPEFKAHGYTSLDHFLEAYNAKNQEARVSVLKALRSSWYWKTDDLLLQQLENDKEFDPVADQAYEQLQRQLEAKS
ncbi:hypothetical protein PsorP6_004277 [Peronosclerospora sorghi]|uniref:Uncharacterized protein n=1 Tax=Peronosclerospora sorghi TaxID=230839 RepID=A0ACC0VQC0_9STRA|nr:hypothetical protein PsorP6_004277 [Peronosclerospora sorghi]